MGVEKCMYRLFGHWAFAHNNPVNRIDPSGKSGIDDALMVLDLYSILRHDWSEPTKAIPIGGSGGPDVSRALKRTLLDVESKFYAWTNAEKLEAARALRSPFQGSKAWDILPLMNVGFGDTHFLISSTGGIFRTGTGPWARTVAVDGKVFYASAVNYAIWGKMNRLCYDFLALERAWNDPYEVSYSLPEAKQTVRQWKHFVYDDFGEEGQQAVAFTEYGYTGNLMHAGLPTRASGQVFADEVFDWVWEPNVPR